MAAMVASARCVCSCAVVQRAKQAAKFERIKYQQIRHLLSKGFACDAEWQQRLSLPTLSQVNADFLISQLFVQYDKCGSATAVDMEVFANRIQDVHPTQLNVVESLFQKFRKCPQGLSVIDSMPHAIVRAYLDLKQAKRLLPILKNKVGFGIFPDNFAFCLLLDHFITSKDFASASQVAYEMMLQEDFSHETARDLALYACSQRLAVVKDTLLTPVTDDGKPVLDTGEEVIKVVKFIPLHNYDDHFDIRSEKALLGKTLAMIGETLDHPAYRSYGLLGLGLYEKFPQLLSLLREYLQSPKLKTFYREVLDTIELCLEACRYRTEVIKRDEGYELEEDAEYNARCTLEEKQEYIKQYKIIKEQLTALPELLVGNLASDTEALVKSCLVGRLKQDVHEYKSLMRRWDEQRQFNLDVQNRALSVKEREDLLQSKLKELTEKEELLNFFARSNEVSLGLLRAPKPEKEASELDLEEYVAEPGKRTKKGKLGV